jgi:hypothetical protein
LYFTQAAMSLFNDRISSAVHRGIDGALSGDVPNAINNILASLPTHVKVQVYLDKVGLKQYLCCHWRLYDFDFCQGHAGFNIFTYMLPLN